MNNFSPRRSLACSCPERKKAISERNWVVTQYQWNSGAFVAGDGEWSQYSTVWCMSCKSVMRTKAKYVEYLPLVSREKFLELYGEG